MIEPQQDLTSSPLIHPNSVLAAQPNPLSKRHPASCSSGDESDGSLSSTSDVTFWRLVDVAAHGTLIHQTTSPRFKIARPSRGSEDSSCSTSTLTQKPSSDYSPSRVLSEERIDSFEGSEPHLTRPGTLPVDGPAIESPSPHITRQNSARNNIPHGKSGRPEKKPSQEPQMHDLAHCGPDTPVLNTTVPMGIVQTIPVANVIPQKSILKNVKKGKSPKIPVPAIPGEPALPQPPVLPGLLVDQAGMLPIPDMPKSNTTKRQKSKIRTQRLIRRSRTVVLRKPVLKLILGRALAGPTYDTLTIIAKNQAVSVASTIVDTTSTALPATAPIPI